MVSIRSYIKIIAIAGLAVVAGCSSSGERSRASLAALQTDYPSSGLTAGSDGIKYHDRGAPSPSLAWQSRVRDRDEPVPNDRGGRLPSETASPEPLRRFAAMPRFKAPAPHVRQNESSCLDTGLVRATSFVRPRSSIGGGQCYVSRPFLMHAAAGGSIRFQPAATLRCQMVPSVETWVAQVLKPAARRFLGSDVVELKIAASYGCRTRNSKWGAKLSEHGRANAIDVSAFHTADGRVVTVKDGWRGRAEERQFLRYIRRGACEHFSTVLSPDADRYHHDHFHFDLARHGRKGNYRLCK